MAVAECATASGVEAARLHAAAPYAGGAALALAHRHSWVEAGEGSY
jgi:hypothetical protein